MIDCVSIYLKTTPEDVPSHYIRDGKLFVDLSDNFALLFSKNVAKVRVLSDSLGDETVFGFTLPPTVINDYLFDAILDPTIPNNDKVYLDVWVIANGSLQPFEKLTPIRRNPNGTYECELDRGQSHWIEGAKQTLLNEIPFGTFTFSLQNILNNRASNYLYQDGAEGYYFGDINYGGLTSKKTVSIGYLRPLFSPLKVIRSGMQLNEWTFRSAFLESASGRQLHTYICSPNFSNQIDLLSKRKLRLENPPISLIREEGHRVVTWDDIYDGGDNYNPQTAKISGAGLANWFLTGTLFFEAPTSGSPEVYFYVRVIKINRDGLVEIIGFQDFNVSINVYGQYEEKEIDISILNLQLYPFETIHVEMSSSLPMNVADVQGFVFEKEPLQVHIDEGDVVNVNNYLGSEYSLFDYLKGIVHLTGNGLLYTDFTTKTIYHYPPETVTWNGAIIEGFYRNDLSAIDLRQRAHEGTLSIENKKADAKRFVSLQFAKSSDKYIKAQGYEDNKPPFSHLLDRGISFVNDTDDRANPFFEPTINGLVRLGNISNKINVPMPFMLDNEDDEVSYDIKPRILFGVAPQLIKSEFEKLKVGYYLDYSPENPAYLFQEPNALKSDNSTFEERLVYGEHENSFFEKFWKLSLIRELWSFIISGVFDMNHRQYKATTFRDAYIISYNFKEYFCYLESIIDHNPCNPYGTELSLVPVIERSEGSINTSIDTDTCSNDFTIQIDVNASGEVAASFTDDFTSSIDTETIEYSTDNGQSFLSYALGIYLSVADTIIFRRSVTFTDGCNSITKVRTYSKNFICNNSATIDFSISGEGSIIAANSSDFLMATKETDVWTYVADGGSTQNYNVGDSITNFTTVEFTRVITFQNNICPPITLTRTYSYTATVDGCGNTPEVVCVNDGMLSFFLGGTNIDEILMVIYEISRDEGATWIKWNGIAIPCADIIHARALVIYKNCDNVLTDTLIINCN